MYRGSFNLINPLPAENIIAGTTVRSDGFSAKPYLSNNMALHVGDNKDSVAQNRAQLAQCLGINRSWQWLDQIHSNSALKVDKPQANLQADALYTKTPNLVLSVLTADCLPVFFVAQSGQEIAIAHAGWRGLLNGVLENTLSLFDCEPRQVHVFFGPAIGPCHFEIGQEVKSMFADKGFSEAAFFKPLENDKYLCDIVALAKARLSRLGVCNFTSASDCTVCHDAKYFSYRRDECTGRMANFIAITSASV